MNGNQVRRFLFPEAVSSYRILPAFLSAICAVSLLLATARVEAGEVTGLTWHAGINSVGAEPIVPPSAPNNDGASGNSPNHVLIPQKHYVAVGPVDLVFAVADSGGTTEYAIAEGVSNSTGIDWSGYRLELGFGHGAGFEISPAGDGLDFDAPEYNSNFDFSDWFSSWTVNEDVVTASGGIMPDGAYSFPYFVFHVDVPDGITSFTIRQIPIPVPEPSALALCGLATTMLCSVRQRK